MKGLWAALKTCDIVVINRNKSKSNNRLDLKSWEFDMIKCFVYIQHAMKLKRQFQMSFSNMAMEDSAIVVGPPIEFSCTVSYPCNTSQ